MRIPTIRGVIDRRILVNFRVDVDELSKLCPDPFRPLTVDGYGIAGICLIRLRAIRPKFLPSFLGISSENAAHRIAVEWDGDDGPKSGVYIPRRDTSSRLNVIAGGRVFPGVHHFARFDVHESADEFNVAMESADGDAHLRISGQRTDTLPVNTVFSSLQQCSQFFQSGSLGYSPAGREQEFDGLQLRTLSWQVTPLAVSEVSSSFFDDRTLFSEGAVEFDNALLMQGIEHEWSSQQSICCIERR